MAMTRRSAAGAPDSTSARDQSGDFGQPPHRLFMNGRMELRCCEVGTNSWDISRGHRSPDAGGHGGGAGAGYSTCVNAWMSTPTMHPTIVPLMRMNCRSRPTWSSMSRAVDGPSHFAIVDSMSPLTSLR